MIEQGNVKLAFFVIVFVFAFFGAIELRICKAILFFVAAYCFCLRAALQRRGFWNINNIWNRWQRDRSPLRQRKVSKLSRRYTHNCSSKSC